YYCGVWNGVIEEVQGLGQLTNLFIEFMVNENARTEIIDAVSNISVSLIVNNIIDSYNQGQFRNAHQGGKHTVMIASLLFGFKGALAAKNLKLALNPKVLLIALTKKAQNFVLDLKKLAISGLVMIESGTKTIVKVTDDIIATIDETGK